MGQFIFGGGGGGGSVISVTGTAPVVSSGGTTPVISMHVADATHDGYLSSTDWNTFSNGIRITTVSVAAAQALAASNGFIQGWFYKITDPDIIVAQTALSFVILQATSVNSLAINGLGRFANYLMSSAITAEIEYDLTNGKITRVYGGAVGVAANDVTGNSGVGAFNFENSGNFGNVLDNVTIINDGGGNTITNAICNNCTIDWGGFANRTIDGSVFESGSTISLSAAGSITNSYVGAGASLALINKGVVNIIIGNGSSLIAADNSTKGVTIPASNQNATPISVDLASSSDVSNCIYEVSHTSSGNETDLAFRKDIFSGSFSGVGAATTTFAVTIGSTLPTSTYQVNVTPTNALSAALFFVENKTATTFDVTYLSGLTGTVEFDYIIKQ